MKRDEMDRAEISLPFDFARGLTCHVFAIGYSVWTMTHDATLATEW